MRGYIVHVYIFQQILFGIADDLQYEAEKQAGDIADLFGTNKHRYRPATYKDLSRKFVPQYPYIDLQQNENSDSEVKELIPLKAPPELVLAVAKKSAQLEASKPFNPSDEFVKRDILRTGDYWNGVWKEDVDPKILRSNNKNSMAKINGPKSKLNTVRVKIMPGTSLYQLVSALKNVSPTLLYIINKNEK